MAVGCVHGRRVWPVARTPTACAADRSRGSHDCVALDAPIRRADPPLGLGRGTLIFNLLMSALLKAFETFGIS